MKQRVFVYLSQMALVLAALFAARELTFLMWLVPGSLRKQSPIDNDALLIITLTFLVFHALMLGVVQLINRTSPFANFRRFVSEVYAALVATSLAASAIFLFTDIPFSANFYAWVYVIIVVGYLALFGSNLFLSFSSSEAVPKRSFVSLLISPWTVVTAVLVASPGLLAGLYKANQDFSNSVNGLRASLNTAVESEWSLTAAYPGQLFEQPMYLAFEPERDESFIVLSRPGRLFRYVTAPDWQEEILLDLSQEVDSIDVEMGAYSFALHPDFNQPQSDKSGFAYVYYTHVNEGRHFNRLVRFDLSLPTQKEREESRMVLIDLERLPSGMHNGGGIFFGPDGFLYFSLGDFMMADSTQQIDDRLLGGIFRIDVDMQGGDVSAPIKRQPEGATTQNYYIPIDNPWYGSDDALEEYWALGFRNPWRMSMDPETGSIWLGDVGVNRYEEQNRVEKGDNGQWNYREGNLETGTDKPEAVIGREIEPVYSYEQTALARASMGGVVYRGAKYPQLQGKYLFADNQAGTLHTLDPDDPEMTAQVIAQAGQFGQLGITSLQARADGEIYMTVLGNKERRSGEIVRLVLPDDAAVASSDVAGAVATDDAVETKYVSVCSRCHGLDGKGAAEMDLGEEAMERPDFTTVEWQDRVTDDYLKRVIVEGGDAVGISEQMPAWGDFFDEDELDGLIEKLRAFK